MHSIIYRYKFHFKNREFLISLISGVALFVVSLIVNYHAGLYATEIASNPVTDIFLSNVPVLNLDGTFIYGTIIFWLFVLSVSLIQPKKAPFILKSIALFILIRSLFITLTHIGPFPSHMIVDSSVIGKFTFGGDLFFSGHTGLPFLFALIFWKDKKLRYFFIITSISFGFVVLLAHLHYSIDVLSAFFITYTIYHLSTVFFKKDVELFNKETPFLKP